MKTVIYAGPSWSQLKTALEADIETYYAHIRLQGVAAKYIPRRPNRNWWWLEAIGEVNNWRDLLNLRVSWQYSVETADWDDCGGVHILTREVEVTR